MRLRRHKTVRVTTHGHYAKDRIRADIERRKQAEKLCAAIAQQWQGERGR